MKVYILDIEAIEDRKYGGITYRIKGQLQSGLEIKINDLFYDLQGYVYHHVEMLLCVLRSPYAESKKGINNQLFLSEEYYSVELIDELLESKGIKPKKDKKWVKLTGKYYDSYVVPKKWVPLIKSEWFKPLLNRASAIETTDGIFLLYPYHMNLNPSIKEIPPRVSLITGSIDLVAWYPVNKDLMIKA